MPANIVAVNNLIGRSKIIRLTTNYTTILTNITNSNEVFKINTIMAVNDGVITPGVTLQFVSNDTSYNLAELLQVPVRSNAIIIDKDIGLYLEENTLLQAKSSINNTIVLVISYEVIASPNPSPYSVLSVVPDTNLVYEGGSVNVAITTANITAGNLYWVAAGTVSSFDFVGSSASGIVPIVNNYGSVRIDIADNSNFEGSESFILSVRPGPDSAVVLASSSIINLAESTPTAIIDQSTTQVVINGVRTINYAITTTNIQENTYLYWSNVGNSLTNDFDGNIWYGNSLVTNNRANINLVLSSSFNYANTKSIILQIRSNNVFGPVIATSLPVTATSYSVSTSAYSVLRGGSVTFTISSVNVPTNTVLYWRNEGSASSSDFASNVNSGTLALVSNTASLSFTINNAAALETEETIKIVFRVGSVTGYTVAVSPTVIVLSEFGEAFFSLAGTYTWIAPVGTSSVDAICVGGGGGGNYGPNSNPGTRAGGGGGALAYRNDIPVTAGTSYTVVVGAAGPVQADGGASYFISAATLQAGGGGAGTSAGVGGAGGAVTAPGGGGGAGGAGGGNASTGKGAGGAGGYAGAGGTGTSGSAGAGGGGGASIATTIGDGWGSAGGGGVNVFGQGTNGFGGAAPPGQPAQAWYRGGGGSGGTDGSDGSQYLWGGGGSGGKFGGGGGYGVGTQWGGGGGPGGAGAVRILWGPNRSFPSTNVGEGDYTP